MNNENKKYIIILLVIALLSLTYGIKYLNKLKSEKLPEVKLKEKVNKDKSFAIMIQNGDTYKEYTSKDSKWPNNNYIFSKAECIDYAGNRIEDAITFNNETRKVTLKSKKTIYCTLYFDKSILGKLRENDFQNKLSSSVIGGMYRFQGKNTDEINNYVCFGTDNKEDCINEETGYDKYMYRIIGITEEGQLYLIKMKGVEEGENQHFQWNSRYESPDCDGDACEWPNVDIYKRLNGEVSNGNPIFINNPRYEYMVDGNPWYNKIEKHNWMYGDLDYSISYEALDGETVYGARNSGLILYDIETGMKPTQHYEQINNSWKYVKHQWSAEKSVNAKIGLMYLHDYYLAYNSERNWRDDYDTNNWILLSNNINISTPFSEWFISRYGAKNEENRWIRSAWLMDQTGHVTYGFGLNFGDAVIRPTFYLSVKTNIKSGSGSIDNPYILSS